MGGGQNKTRGVGGNNYTVCFLFAFSVQHSYKPGCHSAAHFELLKYIRDIFMKKLLILALFLTSSFFENGLEAAAAEETTAIKKAAQLAVPAAQPPAKIPAPPALLAWLQKVILKDAGRRRSFLRLINILHKSLDISAEFSSAVHGAFNTIADDPRIEGIWILKENGLSLNPNFYEQLIQTAVVAWPGDARMEALFALDQPDIILNERQKFLLLPALEDKNIFVRKKSYQILSAERHRSRLPEAVSQAIAKALAKKPYFEFKPYADQVFYNYMMGQHGNTAGAPPLPRLRSWHIDKLKYANRSDPGLSTIIAKILQNEQSPAVLLSAVRVIKDLRLVNKETLAPLMQLLVKTKNRGLRKEIIQAAALSRPGWEPLIFESVLKVVFNMDDIHAEFDAYYLLDQQLWQHPVVQKNIQTVFKSGWQSFYLSKNKLHSVLLSHSPYRRIAALYCLSQISKPLNSEVQSFVVHSLAGPSVFDQLMALSLTSSISEFWEDAEMQQLKMKTAQKIPSPLIRLDPLLGLFYRIDAPTIRGALDIVNFDSSLSDEKESAIRLLQAADWSAQPAGVQKLFTDKMLELLNHPSAELQNTSLWALGFAGPHAEAKKQKLIQRKIAQFLTHSSLETRNLAEITLTRFKLDDPEVLAAVKKVKPRSCKNTFKTPA